MSGPRGRADLESEGAAGLLSIINKGGPRDPFGREWGDPLWGLPHDKCSCASCVTWRAKWAWRIGPAQLAEVLERAA